MTANDVAGVWLQAFTHWMALHQFESMTAGATVPRVHGMDIALFQSLTRAGVPDEQARATANGIRAEINRQAVCHTAPLATREELGDVRTDIHVLQVDVVTLKTDVAILKTDVSVLKTDVAALKADTTLLRQEIKTNMAELRHEVKTEIQSLRTEVLDRMASLHRWTLGTSLTVTGLVLAVARAWPSA